MEILIVIITAVFVNNILLAQFLGQCPFCGVSKKFDTAFGMGMAVLFVMILATAITWIVQALILVPTKLEYLQTLVFILVIASLVQLVEMFLKKSVPSLYKSLGVFLPLITTNCAVLGTAINCVQKDMGFIEAMIYTTATAIGFLLAIVIMSGIRGKYEISPIPRAFQGTAITLITAGIMAMAFTGFIGIDASLIALK